jgi:hypothetical protein
VDDRTSAPHEVEEEYALLPGEDCKTQRKLVWLSAVPGEVVQIINESSRGFGM